MSGLDPEKFGRGYEVLISTVISTVSKDADDRGLLTDTYGIKLGRFVKRHHDFTKCIQ